MMDSLFEIAAPAVRHQRQLAPAANKFHVGNGDDGKHYLAARADARQAAYSEAR